MKNTNRFPLVGLSRARGNRLCAYGLEKSWEKGSKRLSQSLEAKSSRRTAMRPLRGAPFIWRPNEGGNRKCCGACSAGKISEPSDSSRKTLENRFPYRQLVPVFQKNRGTGLSSINPNNYAETNKSVPTHFPTLLEPGTGTGFFERSGLENRVQKRSHQQVVAGGLSKVIQRGTR